MIKFHCFRILFSIVFTFTLLSTGIGTGIAKSSPDVYKMITAKLVDKLENAYMGDNRISLYLTSAENGANAGDDLNPGNYILRRLKSHIVPMNRISVRNSKYVTSQDMSDYILITGVLRTTHKNADRIHMTVQFTQDSAKNTLTSFSHEIPVNVLPIHYHPNSLTRNINFWKVFFLTALLIPVTFYIAYKAAIYNSVQSFSNRGTLMIEKGMHGRLQLIPHTPLVSNNMQYSLYSGEDTYLEDIKPGRYEAVFNLVDNIHHLQVDDCRLDIYIGNGATTKISKHHVLPDESDPNQGDNVHG